MATQTNAGSPAWSTRLISELHDADQRMKSLADTLTLEQLNWQANPNSWSIGQCIEHLWRTNEVYLPPIAKALEDKIPNVAKEITPGWPSRWFISNIIEPSPNGRRTSAPKKIVPTSHVDSEILNHFLQSNQTLRDLIARASAYDVNRIRFKNPFIAGLRFTIGTGFLIICSHQRRHLLQMERVKQSPGLPA